ncbi:hypothetical protein G5V59_15555 [Nocardioides sp. W3-2-3]|uniref:alkaline phosphatase n=1 Tax=Nocardioides convexus TaxID=2712224 RepID=UPI0024181F9A|nr:alkaline phosphatase [Nocardioides convexus]NHA00857.1 hypothetical protein [Nocardioides convexus]
MQKNSGQPGAADFSPNYVTDSSSAATAWSSGVKTYNNANGIDAKANITPTLMELAHQAGLSTGNVSTAEITDATPAGQMSHTLQRACQGPNYVEASCQAARGHRWQPAPDRRPAGHPDRRPDRDEPDRRRHPGRRPEPLRPGQRGQG